MVIVNGVAAAPSTADAYPTHFGLAYCPELLDLPGFLGAHLAKRQFENKIEFLVLTRWLSIDAITRFFAGSDISKAVVEPGAVGRAARLRTSVQHYEVIERRNPPPLRHPDVRVATGSICTNGRDQGAPGGVRDGPMCSGCGDIRPR